MTTPVIVPASDPWPHPAEQVGYVLGGRYRLEESVASGAMGSIWRGRHIELKSPVAIKFLDVSVTRETEMHGRFLQEARAAAAVRCAHVVQVFDYGREGHIPFIVMEWLDGETLERRLQRGVLTPRELDKIFREVACGVRSAHASGVVHRDVKPSNIFLAREGVEVVTKLIDFGIVKVDEARLGFTPRASTRAGTVIGTPEYMSPEQLRAGAEIDHSVDLWALAIVAFECLTGRLPFLGNSMTDLIVQICTEEAVAPSSLATVPAGFDRWFAKATQKDAAGRFASAQEMAETLSLILRNTPESSSEKQAVATGAPVRTRRLGVASLIRSGAQSPVRAGLLAIALLGIAIALVIRPARIAPPAPVAQQQASPPAALAAAEVAAPSTSSGSVTPSPTPASAPTAAIELPAATSRVPSSRPVEAKEPPKARHPSGQRPANAQLAAVNGAGTADPPPLVRPSRPPAPALGRANHEAENRPAASQAQARLPSVDDADSLFAERW